MFSIKTNPPGKPASHFNRKSKKSFNDTIFHHFVDELKHCNPDM